MHPPQASDFFGVGFQVHASWPSWLFTWFFIYGLLGYGGVESISSDCRTSETFSGVKLYALR